MKCPHCNKEHSDDTLFCENTGKKIEKSLKACTNSDCQDFGKYLLPYGAAFCPRCGQRISNSEVLGESTLNYPLDKRFFPIYGTFILGQTSAEDFVSFRTLDTMQSMDSISMSFRGIKIYQDYCDDAFSVLEIIRGVDFPEQWQDEFGWGWHYSLKEMIKILHNNGFVLPKIESPYYHSTPLVIAYSPDGRYEMIFKYGQHGRTKWGCELLNFKMVYHREGLNAEMSDKYDEYCKEWEYYDF